MKKKWTVAIGVTIGAMVFGMAAMAAAPYVAYAQAAATATTTPGTNGAPGAGHPPGGFHGPRERDALVSATASVTGLTAADVNTQLKAGQSLAQIAQSKGKTAGDVIQAARAALTTQLQQSVTDGKLTQAQSDAELAQFDQQATQIVNDTSLGADPGPGPRGQDGPRAEDALVNAAASVTGLSAQDVLTQLQAGQSLTQIATAKGKTAADVIQAARATLSTQLGQAVTAGTITQAQSDAQLADFDQKAPQIVADTSLGNHGGPGFGFGRGGPGGPGDAGALITAAASVTGLTNQDVLTQLQAGQSLAQIAQSKGKTADDVIAAARTALTTQLQQAVTAGRLTQAQSDAQMAQFNADATQIVNDATLGQHASGPQGGGPGGLGGHWGGGPNGRGGPNGQNNPANPTPTAPAASTATNS